MLPKIRVLRMRNQVSTHVYVPQGTCSCPLDWVWEHGMAVCGSLLQSVFLTGWAGKESSNSDNITWRTHSLSHLTQWNEITIPSGDPGQGKSAVQRLCDSHTTKVCDSRTIKSAVIVRLFVCIAGIEVVSHYVSLCLILCFLRNMFVHIHNHALMIFWFPLWLGLLYTVILWDRCYTCHHP